MPECQKCGSTEFYKDGRCAPCKRASSRAWKENNRAAVATWYEANKERITEYQRSYRASGKNNESCAKYRVSNQVKRKESVDKWRFANADKVKANAAKWAKDNPEKCRIKTHNRRAKIRASGGTLSPGLADLLFKRQRGKCASNPEYCRRTGKRYGRSICLSCYGTLDWPPA